MRAERETQCSTYGDVIYIDDPVTDDYMGGYEHEHCEEG
jgi:hypothetical protein